MKLRDLHNKNPFTGKMSFLFWVYPQAVVCNVWSAYISGLILGLHLANERCRYKVTPSLIGWAQT